MPYEIINVRSPYHNLDLQTKCPKHPSIPLATCRCTTHQKTLYKQVKGPRLELDAKTAAINKQSFLVERRYQVTICGSCGSMASDHQSYRQTEYTTHFKLVMFSRNCKHCGVHINGRNRDQTCHERKDSGKHEKRAMIRSRVIAVCADCHGIGEIETRDASDYENRPESFVQYWIDQLKAKGIEVTERSVTSSEPLKEYRPSKADQTATIDGVSVKTAMLNDLVNRNLPRLMADTVVMPEAVAAAFVTAAHIAHDLALVKRRG